jgi:F0F1-type ATP synthase assembly protein I
MPMRPLPNDAMQYASAGIELFLTMGLALAGGYGLDVHWDVLPLFTLLGLVLGFGAGLTRLIFKAKDARPMAEDHLDDRRDDNQE